MSTRDFSITVLAFGLVIGLSACGGGNPGTGPSPVNQVPVTPSPVDQPVVDQAALSVQCSTDWDGYQCRAFLGFLTSNPQDVTGFATWSTSDPGIATVDSVGFVTVRTTGTVAIRATFRGALGFQTLLVQLQEVPIQIRTFWGYVTDAQSGIPLSGVTVQILDGPNANRTAATGADGLYRMGDLGLSQSRTIFSFRVLFSKPGYSAVERVYTMTTTKFNELTLSLVKVSS